MADSRDAVAKARGFASVDPVQFPANPQATRAFEQIASILTARFGARSPFLEQAPTWGALAQAGVVVLRTRDGKVIDTRSFAAQGDVVPLPGYLLASPQDLTIDLMWERDDNAEPPSPGEAG